jgi:hypothetical protein
MLRSSLAGNALIIRATMPADSSGEIQRTSRWRTPSVLRLSVRATIIILQS